MGESFEIGLNVGLAIVGVTILLLGLVSGHIKSRYWVSEPLICVLIGFLVGPAAGGLLVLDVTGDETDRLIVHEVARVTLAISIMGTALRLSDGYVRRNARDLALVLGLGMPLMCLVGAGLAWAILPLAVLPALLLGAILAPTDPVLADSIITGTIANRSVPQRLRDLISAESGSNDGLGLLLVLLPVALLKQPPGEAVTHWLTAVLLWEIIAGTLIGILLGWLARRALTWARQEDEYEAVSALASSVALAIAVLACVDLIQADGLLAVFAAGVVFARTLKEREDPAHEHVQEAIGRFLDMPVFIVLGAILPWSQWYDFGAPAVLFAILVLALRRVPAWLLIGEPLRALVDRRDSLFAGWFGPIGIAALFYVTGHETDPAIDLLWPIVTLVIFLSVVLHGISATPLTKAYGRACGERRT